MKIQGNNFKILEQAITPEQTQEIIIQVTAIDKWDYIKLKRFCTAKEMINKMRQSITK